MYKRQFLDWLYEHPRKYSKLFRIKNNSGYYNVLSPNQLLEEINNNTEIGIKIIQELENNDKKLNLIQQGVTFNDDNQE